jgi:hypothetical protein
MLTKTDNIEDLVRKLRSLQDKTTANGCTEQEALQAAEKVAELLDKYGLSVEQLKLETAKEECRTTSFDLGSKRRPHCVILCSNAIAKYTSTRSWWLNTSPVEYVFFGFPSDVKIAGWLLGRVKKAMDREYGVHYAAYTGPLHWKTVQKVFMTGMANRLNARLTELTEKRSAKPPVAQVVEAGAEAEAPPRATS